MKSCLYYSFFLFLTGFSNWGDCKTNEEVSLSFLADFGGGNENTLTFLGSPINPIYFSSPLSAAYDQGNDYSLSISISELVQESNEVIKQMLLSLSNPGPGVRTICVSAVTDKEAFQSFLIRLNPGEWKTLDASDFLSFKEFLFVCIDDFHASVGLFTETEEFFSGGDAQPPLGLRDLPPENLYGFCNEFDDPMWVEHYAAPATPERAYFRRVRKESIPCSYYLSTGGAQILRYILLRDEYLLP